MQLTSLRRLSEVPPAAFWSPAYCCFPLLEPITGDGTQTRLIGLGCLQPILPPPPPPAALGLSRLVVMLQVQGLQVCPRPLQHIRSLDGTMAKGGDKKRVEQNAAHLRKLQLLIAGANVSTDLVAAAADSRRGWRRLPLPASEPSSA